MRPRVCGPTGMVIGAPVSTAAIAALQAVGRLHRDGPDATLPEVLLHLGDHIERFRSSRFPTAIRRAL